MMMTQQEISMLIIKTSHLVQNSEIGIISVGNRDDDEEETSNLTDW